MRFSISKEVYDNLISYGNKFSSKEVCGALVGYAGQGTYTCDQFNTLTNVSKEDQGANYVPDPNEFFNVLSKTKQFDKTNTKDLVGIFHTHPHSLPIPSQIDINGAGYAGIYIIYSPKYDKLSTFYYNGDETDRKFIPTTTTEII